MQFKNRFPAKIITILLIIAIGRDSNPDIFLIFRSLVDFVLCGASGKSDRNSNYPYIQQWTCIAFVVYGPICRNIPEIFFVLNIIYEMCIYIFRMNFYSMISLLLFTALLLI